MPFTLAQLRAQLSPDDLKTSILSKLTSAGVPVDAWAPAEQGGVEMSNVQAVANELGTYAAPGIVATTEAQFLDLATGKALELHALKRYKLAKRFAQATIQSITLYVGPGAPPADFPAGQVWFRSEKGTLYRSVEDMSIKPNTTTDIPQPYKLRAAATVAGAAANADVAGTIKTLITPALPDVTCVNQAPSQWTDAVLSGVSYGTVRARFVGSTPPVGYSTLKVKIDASGDAEHGAFSWSKDGGQIWITAGPLYSGRQIDAYTILDFVDSNTTHPSFIIGATFSLSVADAIVQRGTDDETDEALRRRCRNRWPGLAEVPTGGTIDLWAHEASPEVDRVLVEADEIRAGWMNVRIAAVDGPVSEAAVLVVSDFINRKLDAQSGGFEHASVSNVDALQISVVTTIYVKAALLAEVQAAAQAAWVAYIQGIPIGGRVLSSALFAIVMNAGAEDMDSETTYINGVLASYPFTQLGPTQVPVVAEGGLLADTVTWSPR